jgi:hypothetical protein
MVRVYCRAAEAVLDSAQMDKKRLIVIRATQDDRRVLEECKAMTGLPFTEVIRLAIRRYHGALAKGRRK